MNKLLLPLFFIMGPFINAQAVFPDLTCETLSNKTIHIPADMAGKKTVICLAMSPKADKTLRVWNNPLYNTLIADGMGGLMSGRMYDVNLCFVGMLKGVAKLGLNEVKKQSREKVEKKLHDYFMISNDDVRTLMEQLEIRDAAVPHFFILDANGKIIYHTSGTYSDDKLNGITERLL